MRAGLDVLIVDDEPRVCEFVRDALSGCRVIESHSGPHALDLIRSADFDVVLLDLKMPGWGGLEVLRALAGDGAVPAVVILTGYGDLDSAVAAMRLGARDYLRKPIGVDSLRQAVLSAAGGGRRGGPSVLPEPLALAGDVAADAPGLLGADPKIRAVRGLVEEVAPTTATVLITGETGTGKELVAGMIHRGSPRAAGPFVVVDCPSVPVSLFESEVFGHERGAFTGAVSARRGKLEDADRGSLFLDEVGELTLDVQPKLLRFLQERRVARIGRGRAVQVDVRVIAASNRDLRAMVSQGTFRADLFHRLDVVPVELPPLRERQGDIPLLVTHFVARFCRALGVAPKAVPPECLGWLVEYAWPGNVRELENVIQRACILSRGATLTPDALPARLSGGRTPDALDADRAESLATVDRRHVLDVLRREGGNISRAARILGIHRATLYRRLLALGLRPERVLDRASG